MVTDGLKQTQTCTNDDKHQETSINQTQIYNHRFNKRKIVTVSPELTKIISFKYIMYLKIKWFGSPKNISWAKIIKKSLLLTKKKKHTNKQTKS